MLGHKKPLGGSMLGHKLALHHNPIHVPMTPQMEQPTQSPLLRKIKRGAGMNLGILNA